MSAATAVTKRSKSNCTMAGAFTSAPANHAKTEWPPDIKFREMEKGRNGEWAKFPRSRVDSATNDPPVGLIILLPFVSLHVCSLFRRLTHAPIHPFAHSAV